MGSPVSRPRSNSHLTNPANPPALPGRQLKKWTAAGVSLERIGALLHGEPPPVPPRPRSLGSVTVCSHLAVTDGIEVVIDPARVGLTPEQVRAFVKGAMAAFAAVSAPPPGAAPQTERQP